MATRLAAGSSRPVARPQAGQAKAPAFGKRTVAANPIPAPTHVCQARIANIEIPNNKPVRYSLQYIYGVGDTTACQILAATGIDFTKRTHELSEDEVGQIRAEINNYTIEGDLRRIVNMNIKRLKDIQCYRGTRHIAHLPCRGQKTKNNARTRKGKKGAAVAAGRR